MKRFGFCFLPLAAFLFLASNGYAQVSVRAPFVRVRVGPPGIGGVQVRAPFVNINVPPRYPVYIPPRRPVYVPSSRTYVPPSTRTYTQPKTTVSNRSSTSNNIQSGPVVSVPVKPVRPVPGNQLPKPRLYTPPAKQSSNPTKQPTKPTRSNRVLKTVYSPNHSFSHKDFAKFFRPAEGAYQVTMIHPKTKRSVLVDFTLPTGNPKIQVSANILEFDYGNYEVAINFTIDGKVKVGYNK